MIRWKYVIPRLLIVATVVAAVYFGLNPLIRWTLIQAGQSATGAKVDIGYVKTSLTSGKVAIEGIQIANPHDTDRNLIEADHAVLNLSVTGLMRRKFIVEDGTLDGIRFGTQRSTSGELPQEEDSADSAESVVVEKLAAVIGPWLGEVQQRLEQTIYDQSETIQVADEIARRWPTEYAKLRQQADDIKLRIERVRETIRAASENPLRNIGQYQRTLDEIPIITRDVEMLYVRIDQLSQQIPRDRLALEEAKLRDQQKLQDLARVRQLDGESLSQVALGEESGRRFHQITEWLRWTRSAIPNPKEDFIPTRYEGTDIAFGRDQQPDLLIRHLRLSGSGRIAGDKYDVAGTLQGLTTEPKLYGKPVLLDITADGPRHLTLSAEFNRASTTPYDRYRIVCPAIDQGTHQVGDAETLLLAFDGGQSGFECNLVVQGEEIAGIVRSTHRDVSLSVDQLSDEWGGVELQSLLSQSLQEVDSFNLTLHLSGSIDDPEFRFESDLGPRVAASFQATLSGEVDRRIQQAANQLDQLAAHHMAGIEEQFNQHAGQIANELRFGHEQLTQFQNDVAERLSFGRIR